MITNIEHLNFEDMIIKCQDCDSDAEFLLKEGEKYLPFCEQCIKNIAFEELINNNLAIEISEIDDANLAEIRKENNF